MYGVCQKYDKKIQPNTSPRLINVRYSGQEDVVKRHQGVDRVSEQDTKYAVVDVKNISKNGSRRTENVSFYYNSTGAITEDSENVRQSNTYDRINTASFPVFIHTYSKPGDNGILYDSTVTNAKKIIVNCGDYKFLHIKDSQNLGS